MPEQDATIKIKALLEPIIEINERLVDRELQKIAKGLTASIDRFIGQSGNVDITPTIDDQAFRTNLTRLTQQYASTLQELQRVKAQDAKTDEARVKKQQQIVDIQNRQAQAVRGILSALEKGIGPARKGIEGFDEVLTGLSAELARVSTEGKRAAAVLRTEFASTEAATRVKRLGDELRKLPDLQQISEQTVAGDLDDVLEKRSQVLQETRKIYAGAGLTSDVRRVEGQIEQQKEFVEQLQAIRRLQELPAAPTTVPLGGLTPEQLNIARERQKLLETALVDTDRLSDLRKEALQVEKAALPGLIQQSKEQGKEYRRQAGDQERIVKLTRQRAALLSDAAELEKRGVVPDTADADRYRTILGEILSLERRLLTLDVDREGQERQELREAVDLTTARVRAFKDLEQSQKEQATAARAQTREQEAATKRLNDLLRRREVLQRGIQGVEPVDLVADTAQADRYLRTLRSLSSLQEQLIQQDDRLGGQRYNQLVTEQRLLDDRIVNTRKLLQAQRDRLEGRRREVEALNRELDTYAGLEEEIRRVSFERDPERLQQLRRDLQAQNKALVSLEKAEREYGLTATRGREEIREQIQRNDSALRDLNQRINLLTGGWNSLNNTVRQFFRYALFYGGMYEVLAVVTALGRATIDLQADFKNIQAVTAATDREMITVSSSIREVALTTRFSAREIAAAATTIGQAGVEPDQIQSVLQSTANFASAVGGSIETAADLITTFRNVYSELSETEIADKLTTAINISKLTSDDLKTIVSISGQTAEDFGLSADQYLAAAATMRNAGIRASTITTGLRQLLIDIFSANSSSLAQLQQRYAELNEDLNQRQIRQLFFGFTQQANPLLAALRELQRIGFTGPAAGQLSRVFEVRSVAALRALIGNIDELQSREQELQFGGAAAEAAAIQMEALRAQLTNVGAAFTFFAEELFRGPIEGLTEFSKGIVEVLDYLTELDLELKAAGGSGVGSDLALGAVAGVAAGLLPGAGGILRRIGVGSLTAVGVGAGSIGAEEEGVGTADIVGWVASFVGLLLALRGVVGTGTLSKLSTTIGGNIAAISTGLTTAITWLTKAGTVGRLAAAGGVVGAIAAVGYGLYELFVYLSDGDDEIEQARQSIAEVAERERAALTLMQRRWNKIQETFKQYEEFSPTAVTGVSGALTGVEEALAAQQTAVQDFIDSIGSSVDVASLRRLLQGFSGDQQARVRGLEANNRLVQRVSDLAGVSVGALNDRNRQLVQLLNAETSLAKAFEESSDEIQRRIEDLKFLSPEELEERGLEVAREALRDLPEEVERILAEGYENNEEAYLSAYRQLTDALFEAGKRQRDEAARSITTATAEEGDEVAKEARKARTASAERILLFRQQGHFEKADRELRTLFDEQAKYYNSLEEQAKAFAVAFRDASSRVPGATTRITTAQQYGTRSVAEIAGTRGAPFVDDIITAAGIAGIDPALFTALVRAESNFNRFAISGKGAQGLTQILPSTALGEFGISLEELQDPLTNLIAGARYLRQQLDDFGGDVSLALAAYNAGPTATRRAGGVPDFPETRQYIERVLRFAGIQPGSTGFAQETALFAEVQRRQAQELERENRILLDLRQKQRDFAEADLSIVSLSRRRRLEEFVSASENELRRWVDEVGGVFRVSPQLTEAMETYSRILGERTREEEAEAERQRQLEQQLAEVSREELQIRLAEIRRRGGSEEEFAAVSQQILKIERQKLENDIQTLREAQKPAKDINVQIAGIRSDIAKLEIRQREEQEAYGRARRKADADLLVARSGLASQELRQLAEAAVRSGDQERADELVDQLIEASTRELEARKASADLIENAGQRQLEYAKIEAETSDVAENVLAVLNARYQSLLAEQEREFQPIAERQERERVLGLTPSREVAAQDLAVQLRQVNARYEEQQAILTKIRELQEEQILSANTQAFLTSQEVEAEQMLLQISQDRAALESQIAATSGGLSQVFSTFVSGAQNQVRNLEETIGNQLVGAVNEFTASLVGATVAGEDLGEAMQLFFHQFFANMATAILQALLFESILKPFGKAVGLSLFDQGGLVPGQKKGGVIGYASGGLIRGPGGVDNVPGVIVGPDGSRSPAFFTDREAVLPAGMVKKLGEANVQAAIDRFNRTGSVIGLQNGGVIQASGQVNGRASVEETESPQVNIDIVNVPGTSVVEDYLTSYRGAQVLLNTLETHPQRMRRMVGGR